MDKHNFAFTLVSYVKLTAILIGLDACFTEPF